MANRIKYKSRAYFSFIHPFMTFEYNCFGYRKAGNEVHSEHDGWDVSVTEYSDRYEGSVSEKRKIVRTAFFARHEEYPKNALFVLFEILMALTSRIRVGLANVAIIGGFICALAGLQALGTPLLIGGAISYALSFIIAIGGRIVRKACKLDEKMDDICEENGWKKWSEYRSRDVR